MYTIKEVCQKTGMSYETLKFYCNKGLVPNVKRDANNYRIFDDHDVEWIKSLTCLKNCGLSLQEMKQYIDLCLQGEVSIPERKIILAQKREDLQKEIAKLQASIDYIDRKQGFYDDVLSGKTKYRSHLIPIGDA